MKKPGRNEKCTCGSGLKFKKCCLGKPFYGPVQHFRVFKQQGVKAWIPITMWAIQDNGDCFK